MTYSKLCLCDYHITQCDKVKVIYCMSWVPTGTYYGSCSDDLFFSKRSVSWVTWCDCAQLGLYLWGLVMNGHSIVKISVLCQIMWLSQISGAIIVRLKRMVMRLFCLNSLITHQIKLSNMCFIVVMYSRIRCKVIGWLVITTRRMETGLSSFYLYIFCFFYGLLM